MEKNFLLFTECPVRNILDRFGDKWSLLVILALGDNEKLRFGEISKLIPDVSQKMLTVTLKTLEADGLVTRKSFPVIPPRVEYNLTDMGKTLVPHIGALVKWAKENGKIIRKSRQKFQLIA